MAASISRDLNPMTIAAVAPAEAVDGCAGFPIGVTRYTVIRCACIALRAHNTT